MKVKDMEAKVLLVLALRCQEDGGLAREILEEQLAMGFPRLGQEVRQIYVELGLPDATRMEVEKKQVREAIQFNSVKEVKAEMTGMIKLKELAMCYLRQPQTYLDWSVEESRMVFRLQTRMLDLKGLYINKESK